MHQITLTCLAASCRDFHVVTGEITSQVHVLMRAGERSGKPLQIICQYKPINCVSLEAQWYSGGRVGAVRTSFLRQWLYCEAAESVWKDKQ